MTNPEDILITLDITYDEAHDLVGVLAGAETVLRRDSNTIGVADQLLDLRERIEAAIARANDDLDDDEEDDGGD